MHYNLTEVNMTIFNFDTVIWLFPILFIFHDFEEIIFTKPWITKNKSILQKEFPKLNKMITHMDSITASSFALGVAEEFVIICVVTFASYFTKSYLLWMGLFITFSLHLVMHCVQALIFKEYVPSVATSIICLPFCLIIIIKLIKSFPAVALVPVLILCTALMIINLLVLHKEMESFSGWEKKISKNSL